MLFIVASLMVVGTFLAYLCRKELRLEWGCRRWPQTTGQISGSIVEEGICQDVATDGTFAPVVRRFRQFEWVFTYSVGDQTYQSSRFRFSPMGWQENTREFHQGDLVTVYYCPANPALAVLEPKLNPELLTWSLGFAGFRPFFVTG